MQKKAKKNKGKNKGKKSKKSKKGKKAKKGDNDNDMMVGGNDDEYGCCTSCGYSWCETLSECVQVWVTPCEDP